MSTKTAEDRLLSIDDLAERWRCSTETAWDRVREHNVRGVWIGRGAYSPSKAGPKTVRFRLATILAWEASQEIPLGLPAAPASEPARPSPPALPPLPGPAIPGWDGKVRGGKRRR